jgi:tetratricopeptide (TPR) repeat protein
MEAAVASFQETIAGVAERVGASDVHAEAKQTLAVCLSQRPGRSAEALETIEEAFALAKQASDVTNLMRSYNNFPTLLSDLASDHQRAEVVVREGLELVRRVGARQNEGWLTGTLGDILARLGRLTEAEEYQRRAIDIAAEVGDEPLRGMRLSALATVLQFRGRIEEAETVHEAAVPILEANPEPQALIYIPWTEALFALMQGANAEAAEHFASTVHQMRQINVESYPHLLPDSVRAFVRAGRRSEAEAFRDLSDHAGSPATRASAALVEGLLSEHPAEASRLIERAISELDALGLRIDAARAMVDLARVKTRLGEDSKPLLERARAILLECDARGFLFEVDEAIADR